MTKNHFDCCPAPAIRLPPLRGTAPVTLGGELKRGPILILPFSMNEKRPPIATVANLQKKWPPSSQGKRKGTPC